MSALQIIQRAFNTRKGKRLEEENAPRKENKADFELNDFSGKMEQAGSQPLPLLRIPMCIYFSHKEKRN